MRHQLVYREELGEDPSGAGAVFGLEASEMETKPCGQISKPDYLRWVQRSLRRHGYSTPLSGVDSKAYRQAVSRFKRDKGVRPFNDKVDRRTQNKMIQLNERNPGYMRWVQRTLNRVGAGELAPSGQKDRATRKAIRAFQRSHDCRYGIRLVVDGYVGSKTDLALRLASESRPPSPQAPPRPPAPAPARTRLNPKRWTTIMRSADLRTGNFVNFLVDGTATFKAMHRAIVTAKNENHYIYLLGWWLSDDFPLVTPRPGVPATLRDLLAAASRRGVQIRAMLWDQFGRKNSAEVRRISALASGAAILDNHTFSGFRLVNVGSHHQKVLVVKGEKGLITFCGGLDINPDRVFARPGGGSSSGGSGSGSAVISSSGGSGGGGNPLHDIHCRLVGPAAHDLLATFIRRWDAHPGHARIDRTKGDLLGRREARPAPLSPRPVGSTGGNCAVRITRTYNPVTPIATGTRAVRERTIRQTLIAAIRNARKFIYLEEQYLVSMEAAALLNAALGRIQHLTILIPDSSITDMPRVWEGRLRFISRLRRGPHGHKARLFILSTPPNRPGTSPNFGRHTYVHAKTWIIDDELAVIGSANCNQRGWTHDSEVNAVIFEDRNPTGMTFAQRLRMTLWAEHLNVPAGSVRDGVASASLWTSPPSGARIRPYNPRGGRDPRRHRLVPWGVIDPAGPP